jgi:D-lyxose ketol-isomerase
MISRKEFSDAQKNALKFFKKAGIILTEEEKSRIEVADLGLGDLTHTGLEIVTYVNTQRCCAKELILFPRQTCPEHRHPAVADEPGKEETFRCRWGTVYLYVPGAKTSPAHGVPPSGRERYYTVWHEVILRPGEQYTLAPDTLHWFQSGDEGAVVSEFSTRSRDESDIFTDPDIGRATQIKD